MIEKFNQDADLVITDDQLFELFCNAAETANEYWESENAGMYISIDRVYNALTDDDIKPFLVYSPS